MQIRRPQTRLDDANNNNNNNTDTHTHIHTDDPSQITLAVVHFDVIYYSLEPPYSVEQPRCCTVTNVARLAEPLASFAHQQFRQTAFGVPQHGALNYITNI